MKAFIRKELLNPDNTGTRYQAYTEDGLPIEGAVETALESNEPSRLSAMTEVIQWLVDNDYEPELPIPGEETYAYSDA